MKTRNKNKKSLINDSKDNDDSTDSDLSEEFNKLTGQTLESKKINLSNIDKCEEKIVTSEDYLNEIYTNINISLTSCYCENLIGEIISFRFSDINAYITIKINSYQINGIFWQITKCKNFLEYKKLVDGDKIKIYGNFSVSKKNFSIYFNIKLIEKVGLGDYLKLHGELRNKIIDLGWHENKKILNKFPNDIGIITSLEGAAIQDILQTFKNDKFIGNIYTINAIVQGKSCPQSIINAINYLESNYSYLKLILITRGGGSYEDLVGFSDWDLICRINKCMIITISAVGHQIDNQLSDEVADYKFPTPTYAAKFITETQKNYINLFQGYKDLILSLTNKYEKSREHIDKINKNYDLILTNYNIKEYKDKMYKYLNKINYTLNIYHNAKKSYYNFVSNMKPTIIKNGKEVTSIVELINPPKKADIILPDGSIKISYKVLEQNI